MIDTIFLTQSLLPKDTTKKSNSVVSHVTIKKDSQTADKQDTLNNRSQTNKSKKSRKKTVETEITKKTTTITTRKENVTEETLKHTPTKQIAQYNENSQKDISQQVPLYPPYLYHIDDTIQYEELQIFDLDSLIASHDSVFYHKSMLKGHYFAIKDTNTTPRNHNEQPSWVFLVIMLVILVIGRMISRYKGYKSDIFLSLFRRTSFKAVLNERAANRVSVNFIINFLYSVLLSLAELFVLIHFKVSFTGEIWKDFLLLVCFTFSFIFIRVMLVKFLGSVFNYKISISAYILNHSICNLLCGTLLVPALLLSFYSGFNPQALLYALTIIIVVIFLIRVIRGSFLLLAESQFSKIYMLYYMFVIEILPIIVIAKWITLNMQ